MTPDTLKALRGSIAKWRAIVDGTGTDRGPQNCPLCQMFIKQDCEGCPVNEKTGKQDCHEIPYDVYVDNDEQDIIDQAAADELAFLISLLPDGEQP
jgi:hypothetical protein